MISKIDRRVIGIRDDEWKSLSVIMKSLSIATSAIDREAIDVRDDD